MKRYYYKTFLFIACYLACGAVLSGQAGVQGKITDIQSLATIPFATVALYQEEKLIIGQDSDFDGNYCFSNIQPGLYRIEAQFLGYQTTRIEGIVISDTITILDITLSQSDQVLDEVIVTGYKAPRVKKSMSSSVIKALPTKNISAMSATTSGLSTKCGHDISIRGSRSNAGCYYINGVKVTGSNIATAIKDNESYGHFSENGFKAPEFAPLSTFSIDVDRASYSNVRRFLKQGQLPPTDAVRIEELINYFDYPINHVGNTHPMALQSTYIQCPWNTEHQLLHIMMNTEQVAMKHLPSSNLVFLIDVSGSMRSENKLPLVIQSLKMLVNTLSEDDRIAIVTYAGSAGVALESTPVSEKSVIIDALESLESGGATAGAEGIRTAYAIAKKYYIKRGNNRVILATDGDFNVGVSSNDALEKLIEEQRESGVYLSVLGYGIGNYKDDKMQILAEKGNGNHAYIDNIIEAKKTLVDEIGATLHTVAKDVKLQVEFNPRYVESYRLIGYESRMLADEDFNNDKKDAGELGQGHQVTAIYELVPSGVAQESVGGIEELRYQRKKQLMGYNNELATIKVRYKPLNRVKSIKFDQVVASKLVTFEKTPEEVLFALGVAEFGLLLSESKYKNTANFESVLQLIEPVTMTATQMSEKNEFRHLVTIARDLLGEHL